MGGYWCGSRENFETDIDSDKSRDRNAKYKFVQTFNWNNNNPYSWTIEEIILCSLTNDAGDYVNPQTSHILFSEFKKFMFLNLMYIQEGEKDYTVRANTLNRMFQDKKAYVGLIAPPIIDLVWCILIRTKIYEDFCNQYFKGFLDRNPSEIGESRCNYQLTIKYLKRYSYFLSPFQNIWPDYDNEWRLFDRKSYITVTPKSLKDIKLAVQEKWSKTPSCDIEDWKTLFTELITDRSSLNTEKEEKPPSFSLDKIRFWGRDKTIKNVLSDIEIRDYQSDIRLVHMQNRYMINIETAKCWLKEYYKFIAFLMKDSSAYFPWWRVQAVFNLHSEFTESFRIFCIELFGKSLYPEDFNVHFNSDQTVIDKYKNTLEEYKAFYGAYPNPDLWEDCESRFSWSNIDQGEIEESKADQDFSNSVSLGVYRLIAVTQLISLNLNPFNSNLISDVDKEEWNSQILETLNVRTERSESQKENQPYKWRVWYPHWTNIYTDCKIEIKEGSILNPYRNFKLKQDWFNCGGASFLFNPFSKSDLTNKEYPDILFKGFYKDAKLESNNDLNLDDISDTAFRNPLTNSPALVK